MEKEKNTGEGKTKKPDVRHEKKEQELSPTWAQECIEDIDDWIESQGIYLRQ